MTVLLSEVILPFTTALPRDVAVNALHWVTPDTANDADFLAITDEINSFFNVPVDNPGEPSDGVIVAEYISEVVSRGIGACRVRFYDAEATDKVLLAETQFTLEDPFDDAKMPNEVAVCISLTSVEGAGVIPQRNRRGRMYLGPLSPAIVGASTVGGLPYPAISSGAREGIAIAAERMATGPSTVIWSIWSPTLEAAFSISGGFIDNEFDTQRRRQYRATSRTNFGVPFI